MIYIVHLDCYKLITEVVYQSTNLDNVIKYITRERLSSEFMPDPENDITYNFTDTNPLIGTTSGAMLKNKLIVFLRESKLHELGI